MRRIILLAFVGVFIFSLGCKGKVPVSKAAPAPTDKAAASQETETQGPKVEEEIYVYERHGRRDPFVSLAIKTEEGPKKGQTPLETYDVGSLKILGIVWNKQGYYAEVILPDGKAYTVKEGTVLGLHEGRIQKITKTSIIVRENIRDYKGDIKTKETTLKLREEEEE